jgi:hypothetical protein
MSSLAVLTREALERLQRVMAQMPQVELPTKHHFAQGLYCRELFRPAGTTIVGKVHKKEHLYIVLSGIVTVIGNGTRETLEAPAILVSAPGTKRAVFAHTDAICCTVHATELKDLEAIEAELIEPDETALFDAHNQLKPELLK